MNERTEAAVADEHVAGLQFRMEMGDLVHVVRPQRRRQNREKKASARVKQGEHVGDGEATAEPLVAGLAKFLLFWSIGHAEVSRTKF